MYPFALNDLFAADVGCEIAGAYLMATGLLIRPGDIAKKTGSYLGVNATEVVHNAQDRVDAMSGLVALGGGFLLQVVGYALGSDGVPAGRKGAIAAAVAVLAAIAGAALIMLVWRLIRRSRVRALLIEISHWDDAGRHDLPDSARLQLYGQAMGELPRQDEGIPRYVKRVFGVEAGAD
jgi:hypothetical protein